MIDFGSTFTKLTAVDTETEDIIATASHFTTVDTDISIGYNNALAVLKEKLNDKDLKFDKIIGCSSAAGGLKMAAIGLVEELTVEASRRVCLGAGAKAHVVRTIVRRAERAYANVYKNYGGSNFIFEYLNKLSTLFFLIALFYDEVQNQFT